MTELYEAALRYNEAGWQIHPLKKDGGKSPALAEWTTRPRPSLADLHAWFEEDTYPGLGVLCGPPSGNLVVVDIEGVLAADNGRLGHVRQSAYDVGVGHLFDAAWVSASAVTPSGGRHLFLCTTDAPPPNGNEKLAFMRGDAGFILLAETRSTGGQVAAPPGPGRAWVGDAGPGSAVALTIAELGQVLGAFRSLDESGRSLQPVVGPRPGRSTTFTQPTSMSVAGALNDALMSGEMTWDAVLDPGWTLTGYDRTHGHSLWLRPDYGAKSSALFSAKGFETDRDNPHAQLVVHSTSVEHLPAGEGQRLTPGRVFAHCWFGGDEGAAYTALQDAVSGGEAHPAVLRLHSLAPRVLERVADIVRSRMSKPRIEEPPPNPDAAPPEPETGPAPMPRGILSPLLEAVTDTVATHTQTPPELAAFVALAAVSAATGGGFVVDAGWQEPVALFAIAVADPSERKSSVLSAVGTNPLRRALSLLASEEQPKRAAAKAAIEKQEGIVADLKKKMRDGSDVSEDMAVAIMDLAVFQAADVPPPDFVVTDATIEALEKLMRDQRGNAAVLSAEGSMLKILVGHYTDGKANVNLLNQAWSHEFVSSARIKRGTTSIERTHATLGLIVQPTVMAMLGNSELTETGFTARWLLCHPRTRIGTRTPDVAPLDRRLLDHWLNTLLAIVRVGWNSRQTLTLSHDAYARFYHLCNEIEALEARATGAFRAWLGKSRGQTLRVAAVIALTDRPENREISLEHLDGAIAFMAWQRTEVRRLFTNGIEYASVGEPEKDVLAWIRLLDKQEFSLRDCHRALQSKFWAKAGGVQIIGEALDSLCAAFVIEELPTTTVRSRRFRVLEVSEDVDPQADQG